MPFSGRRPAIGVSLLKAHLDRMSVPARIEYENLRFAALIGRAAYDAIADVAPTQAFFGDWIFAPWVSQRRASDGEEYLEMVRTRFPSVTGAQLVDLRAARAVAEGFLEECLVTTDWSAYDIVGFTTTFNQTMASLALARRLKERFPGLCVVFGGANCEGEMGLQLHKSFPFVDF